MSELEQQAKLSHQDIAKESYLLWEKEGKPHGRAEAFWLRAEAKLLAAREAQNGNARAGTTSKIRKVSATKT